MPFEPNDEVTISLSAIEWQYILTILQKTTGFSYETTAPLITKINAQATSQMRQPNISSLRGDGVSDPVSATK